MKLLLSFATPVLALAAMNPHPRIWFSGLTDARLATVRSRQAANTADWQVFSNTINGNPSLVTCVANGYHDLETALYMDSYALAYLVYKDSNPALAADYATCAKNLARFAMGLEVGTLVTPEGFTGDGVTTTFTLSNNLYTWCDATQSDSCHQNAPAYLRVNGLDQTVGQQGRDTGKNAYFAYGSNTLTFAVAPPAGAAISIRHHKDIDDYLSPCPYTNPAPCPPIWSSNDYRSLPQKIAVVFDWTYPTLSATDKFFLAHALIASAKGHYSPVVDLFYGTKKGGGVMNNNGAGEVSRIGIIGLATYGDNPSDDTVNQTNDQIKNFDTFFDGVLTPGSPETSLHDDVLYEFTQGYGRGTAIPEGVEYGPQSLWMYVETFDAFRTANGTNYYTRVPNGLPDWPTQVLSYYQHFSSPVPTALGGISSFVPMPAEDEQSQWRFTESDRRVMLHLSEYFGATVNGDYARYWLNTIGTYYLPGVSCGSNCLWEVIYKNVASSTATNYTEVGTDYLSPGAGRLSARSAWTSAATWVGLYTTIPKADHLHAESNSIFLWRNGQVLTAEDPGYGQPYVPHVLHNTMSLNATQLSPWNGLGPAVFQWNADATIPVFESDVSNRYTYAIGDATGAYNSTVLNSPANGVDYLNVQKFNREVVFLKPDYVVILDRVKYANHPAYSRSYFHFQAKPSVASNVLTVTNSGQKLALTTLQPATPTIDIGLDGDLTAVVANTTEDKCGPALSTPPSFTVQTTALSDGAVGISFDEKLAASGGTPPYTWSLAAGTLPAGISLTKPSTFVGWVLRGTPTTQGTYAFTLQVTGANGETATRDFSWVIRASGALTITTSSYLLAIGYTNTGTYNQFLTATGGTAPYIWTVASGSLPPGISLSPVGLLSGIIATPGVFRFTVRVTDNALATATRDLRIYIVAYISGAGACNLLSTWDNWNASVTKTWRAAISSGSSLSVEQLLYVFQGMDAVSSPVPAERITSLGFIAAHIKDPSGDKIIGYSTDPAGAPLTLPVAYSFTSAAATGFHLISKLPANTVVKVSLAHAGSTTTVTLSASTGVGTVFTTSANGVLVFTDNGSVPVQPPLTIVTTSPLPPATVNASYSQPLVASGGTPPYGWSVIAGALPAGLTLSGSSVTGIPTVLGTSSFTIQVSDSAAATASVPLSLTVTASGAVVPVSTRLSGRATVSGKAALH